MHSAHAGQLLCLVCLLCAGIINKETIIRESQIIVDVEETLHLTCILYAHWPVLALYVLLSSYTPYTPREPQSHSPHVLLLLFDSNPIIQETVLLLFLLFLFQSYSRVV